jgi:hypothetical protein
MKVRIVIQTMEPNADNETWGHRHSEVWSGDLELLDKNEYLTKISVIADGEPQPICDIPFAIGIGHYMWIPPDSAIEQLSEGYSIHEGNTDTTER